MSKKQSSRNKDNTIKIAVGIFAAFIVIMGTIMFINNRSLSFIGTIDGTRIPISQFHYQWEMTRDQLGDWLWMMDDMSIAEIAFESLTEIHVLAGRADELGIFLSTEDIENARAEADNIRAWFTWEGQDLIAQMGFSRAAFYRYVEMQTLAAMVAEEVAGRVEITDERLAQDFEDYKNENSQNYWQPFVYFVERASFEEAQGEWENVLFGDIREIIRGEDENVADILPLPLNNFPVSQEIVDFAMTLEAGTLTEVTSLTNGNFGFYLIERFDFAFPEAEIWKPWHEDNLRFEHYRQYLDLWLAQADAQRNERIFRDFWQMPQPEMDIDFDVDIE